MRDELYWDRRFGQLGIGRCVDGCWGYLHIAILYKQISVDGASTGVPNVNVGGRRKPLRTYSLCAHLSIAEHSDNAPAPLPPNVCVYSR